MPLDNHKTLGNNAQFAQIMEIAVEGQSGEQNLLWYGRRRQPSTLGQLIAQYNKASQHQSLYFGDDNKIIKTIAWCTGAAQNMFYQAIDMGVDCYFTGEVNEQIMALSQESAVAYIAGGHYSSEELGIKALCQYLQKQYQDLVVDYLPLYNPI